MLLASDKKVFGRQEVIPIDDKEVTLILVKNPVGLNQVLDMISNGSRTFQFWFLIQRALRRRNRHQLDLGRQF